MQGAQERSLAQRLVRVVRAGFNERSEILDTVYLIAGEKQTAHLPYIQPTVGRAFDTAVIEVEAVNVDICFHKPLNTETAMRRSRTRFAETTTGGYASIIATNSMAVKKTFILFYLKCLNKLFLTTRKGIFCLPVSSIYCQRLGQIPREIRVEPYTHEIFISPSNGLNSLSPVIKSAFLIFASAAAKASAYDILFCDLKRAASCVNPQSTFSN